MGSSGARVEADPETFKVVDGRLFLFSNGSLSNALRKWNRQEERLLRQADVNWASQSSH